MTRTVYDDFDEFADSCNGVWGRYVPTQRSTDDWWIDSLALGRVGVQHVQIGGGATFAGAGQEGMFSVGFPDSDPGEIRMNGHALDRNSMLVLNRGQSFTSSSRLASRWMGISMPLDHLDLWPEFRDAAQRGEYMSDDLNARSDAPHIEQLRTLITRLFEGIDRGEALHAAASSAAQSEAIICVTNALQVGRRSQDRHVGRPQFSRGRVISRALGLIEASSGQPLFIDDLCRATEVSERTLRNIFQEYFGVGPMRLLKVRQLREIRAALLDADPGHDTVTRVASRFGVWDFSLFARNYKALYAESPSETLRKRVPGAEARRDLSWVGYASKIFIDDTNGAEAEGQTEVAEPTGSHA